MTKTEADTHLAAWLAADTAISVGKSYTIGNRQLTRADAAEVKDQLTYWQRVVNAQAASAAGQSSPGVRVAKWS